MNDHVKPAASKPIEVDEEGFKFKFEVLTRLPDLIENLAEHPLAAENPMTDSHEFEAMKDSIGKIGIQVPISLFPGRDQNLEVLDGRNRIAAAKAIGYKFKPSDFRVFVGSVEDAAVYVHAVNNARRHLSKDQKEKLVLDLIAKYPGMSSRKLAVMAGVSHNTIAKLRRPPDDDGKLNALMRAWTNAKAEDQQQFVNELRVDLTEMLTTR
jgi:ParB-like chromosome segregation protein Spo0J